MVFPFVLLLRIPLDLYVVKVQPSLTLFYSFYITKRHPYIKDWWYFFAQRGIDPLIKGAPTIHGWKGWFLFVSCPSNDDWDLSSWGQPKASILGSPRLSAEEDEHFRALRDFKVSPLGQLKENSCSMMSFPMQGSARVFLGISPGSLIFLYFSILFFLVFLIRSVIVDMKLEDLTELKKS